MAIARTGTRARSIDASGQLVDGTAVNGPADLRKALLRRPEQFVQTMTEKLMTYALGRSVEVLRHAGGPRRSCATPRATTIASRRS